MIESALFYAQLGYPVFPCRPNEKRPATIHGLHNATSDENQIRKWWHDSPNANIGLLTAGLLVIDIDGDDWPDLERQRDLDAAGAIATTPRGGRHYVFRRPAGKRWGNSVGKLAQHVDVRTDGGYICVEPSAVDGKGYKWAKQIDALAELPEPPSWLIDELDAICRPKQAITTVAIPSPATSTDIERRAAAYLDAMPEAIQGQNGSGATLAAATALTNGFALPEEIAFGLLASRYNPRCVPVWSENELRRKVAESIRLPHDRPRGYLRDATIVGDGVDLSGFDIGPDESPVAAPDLPADPGPFPERLLKVPGLIGDVMAHNLAGAFRPQPTLALAAALPMMGTLCGRKIADEQDTRTNLYSLALAGTSQGKEHARTVTKDILYAAGLDDLIGPESFASATGIITAIEAQPSLLFQVDEFGRYLKTTGDARNPHLFNIVTVLMRLFTSSSTVYVGDAYADAKRNRKIFQPCANLYGTTTPRVFLEALSAGSIEDGLLGRLLVFEADNDVANRHVAKPELPASLVEAARWWGAFAPGGNLSRMTPQPLIVPSDRDARRVMDELRKLADDERKRLGEPLGDLWPRAVEKANKLALLWACSANRENPAIDFAAAMWASELVRYLTARLVYLASRWVSENRVESLVKRCQRIIEKAGKAGIDGTTFCRKTQFLTQRERDDCLQTLHRSGLVVLQESKRSGRAGYRYFAANLAT